MATYYGTYGQKVQYLASDPSDPQIGQVWYNSTSAVLKVRQQATVNAWASGGAMPTGQRTNASAGTQTSAITFGGTPYSGTTLLYNGTSWTNPAATLNTVRGSLAGTGTQTAALAFGGEDPSPKTAASESWNGTSWTNTPSLNTARASLGGAGTQTASLGFAGYAGGGVYPTQTESWNGSSWTAVPGVVNTARSSGGSAGTQTTALFFGGRSPIQAASESWNGSTWTNTPSLNTGRGNLGGAGTQTSALAFGGTPSIPATNTGATEIWNGTSWTTSPNSMATARRYTGGCGANNNAALCVGGFNGSNLTSTEEWSGIVDQTKTVTVS
jgi:hypothetical protein